MGVTVPQCTSPVILEAVGTIRRTHPHIRSMWFTIRTLPLKARPRAILASSRGFARQRNPQNSDAFEPGGVLQEKYP